MDLRIGSLFSGIGGLELGLEWSGLGHTVWQVEQDEFCQSILAKHWPDAERFSDVREVGAANLTPVDVICGGFPCQDISSAGKGAGLAGSRSGLWFEFARIIDEMHPQWVVVENVASGATRWVDAVCAQLEQQKYEAFPVPLSAEDVGAPHLRRRIFVIAYPNSEQLREQQRRISRKGRENAILVADHGKDGEAPNTPRKSMGSAGQSRQEAPWVEGPPCAPICGVDDGVSNRMDRIRALGNAVVPQCAEVIGRLIKEIEDNSGVDNAI